MDSVAASKSAEHAAAPADSARTIASSAIGECHSSEVHGRDTFLVRTPEGRYFRSVKRYRVFREFTHTSLEPITVEEARSLYDKLPTREIPFDEAFPEGESAAD